MGDEHGMLGFQYIMVSANDQGWAGDGMQLRDGDVWLIR